MGKIINKNSANIHNQNKNKVNKTIKKQGPGLEKLFKKKNWKDNKDKISKSLIKDLEQKPTNREGNLNGVHEIENLHINKLPKWKKNKKHDLKIQNGIINSEKTENEVENPDNVRNESNSVETHKKSNRKKHKTELVNDVEKFMETSIENTEDVDSKNKTKKLTKKDEKQSTTDDISENLFSKNKKNSPEKRKKLTANNNFIVKQFKIPKDLEIAQKPENAKNENIKLKRGKQKKKKDKVALNDNISYDREDDGEDKTEENELALKKFKGTRLMKTDNEIESIKNKATGNKFEKQKQKKKEKIKKNNLLTANKESKPADGAGNSNENSGEYETKNPKNKKKKEEKNKVLSKTASEKNSPKNLTSSETTKEKNSAKKKSENTHKKEHVNKITAEQRQQNSENTLFVGNLPSNLKKKHVQMLFSKFGEVKSIRLRNMDGRILFKHKMKKEAVALNAYVVMTNVESVEKALSLNGTEIKGHHIRVSRPNIKTNCDDQKRILFVGNLKYTATDEKLYDIFSSCGEIEYVRTIRSKEGCNGVGYVCFKKATSIPLAIELNNTLLDDRPIRLERYSTKKLGKFAERKRKAEQLTGGERRIFNKEKKNLREKKFGNKIKTPSKFVNSKQRNENNQIKKPKSIFLGKKTDNVKKFKKKKGPNKSTILAKKIWPGIVQTKSKTK